MRRVARRWECFITKVMIVFKRFHPSTGHITVIWNSYILYVCYTWSTEARGGNIKNDKDRLGNSHASRPVAARSATPRRTPATRCQLHFIGYMTKPDRQPPVMQGFDKTICLSDCLRSPPLEVRKRWIYPPDHLGDEYSPPPRSPECHFIQKTVIYDI